MIAICVGHSRGDGGAVSVGGVNEFNKNRELAKRVRWILMGRDMDALVIDRYAQTSYSRAMALLAASLKSQGVKVAVELHFNSSAPSAHGHEWLHWQRSVPGRALAQCLQRCMKEQFPEAKNRGLVGISDEKSRGGGFLRRTHCPAVICEPFFGSNRIEWEMYGVRGDELAELIANGIDEYLGGES
jgi:N-acetylmuramoyl-L-alanine amidase